ncbi:MAG: hypothetical protein QHJ81_14295 [Anaerolineae bacterium]|nr:hypothetical protein [Anaerolineae bacterium]
MTQKRLFDLSDQERQIGLSEAEIGRGNAMVFDVRGDVFVVGMGAGQRWIIGMGLRIIPVEPFISLRDPVAVCPDPACGEADLFGHSQADVFLEEQITPYFGCCAAQSDHEQSGCPD